MMSIYHLRHCAFVLEQYIPLCNSPNYIKMADKYL